MSELGDLALGGLLVAASLGPSVLAAPAVGVVLDRARHPRRFMLAAAVLTALSFALAAGVGVVPVPIIVATLALSGCVTPFFVGGLSSFVTEEFRDARRGYAHDALSYNLGSVGGPALVALLVAVSSARTAMVALAFACLLGGLGLFALRLTARPLSGATALGTMLAGLRHLVGHRPIAVVTLSGTLSQVGGGALAVVAVVVAVSRAGAADRAAWIVTAFAIGGLVGALVTTVRQWTRLPPVVVMAGGFAATGMLTAVAALDLDFTWTLAVVGASGLFTAPSSAAMLLLRKQQSPLAVRSQIFTVGAGLRVSAAALGAAGAGLLAGVEAGTLLLLVATIWIASALLLLAYPRSATPIDTAPNGPLPTL